MHAASWEYVLIKPMEDLEVDEEIDNLAYKRLYDALINALHVDDNFVVIANADSKEFVHLYLLKCMGEKTCIESPIIDALGK